MKRTARLFSIPGDARRTPVTVLRADSLFFTGGRRFLNPFAHLQEERRNGPSEIELWALQRDPGGR